MIYPIGGKLSHFVKAWRQLKPSRWLLKSLKRGFRLPYVSRKKLSRLSRRHLQSHLSEEDTVISEALVSDYVSQGIAKEVPRSFPLNVNPIFPVPKGDGGHRLVLNTKRINAAFKKESFRMETLRSILGQLRPGLWATKIDIKNAYPHIPIYPPHQRYLCFQLRGRVYTFLGLPFGLSFAPQLFTRVLDQIIQHLLSLGIMVFAYLDDLLIVHESPEVLRAQTARVGTLLERCGWTINTKKSLLEPAQQFEHLGYQVDFKSLTLSIPERKRLSIRKAAKNLLAAATKAPPSIRDVSKLVGMLQALAPAYQFASAHLAELNRAKRLALRKAGRDYSAPCVLHPEALSEIEFWRAHLPSLSGKCHALFPTFLWTTDASGYGLGATLEHYHQNQKQSPFIQEFQEFLLQETTPESINFKELLAVYRSLLVFGDKIRNATVLHRTDNTTTLSYLRRQRGGVDSLGRLAAKIMTILEANNTTLIPTHLPGILNTAADALSRIRDPADEKLNPASLALACHLMSVQPSIDLTASQHNAQFSRFVSYRPAPGAVGQDVFQFDFSGELCPYSNPPFWLIQRLIRRARDLNTNIVMLVPRWPRRQWFHGLKDYLLCPPVKIMPHQGMFLRGSDPQPLQHSPPWPCFLVHLAPQPTGLFSTSLSLDQLSHTLSPKRSPNVHGQSARKIIKQLNQFDPNRSKTPAQLVTHLTELNHVSASQPASPVSGT